MDNECIDFAKVKDDHDYKPYLDAYKQGILKESEIDTALVRLFTARMKLGMFDPPEMVPYSKIDEKELDSSEHRAMARALANESMVLLKNDGTLPLKPGPLKIALVGPLADQTKYLLGQLQRQFPRTRFPCWKDSRRNFLKRRSALFRGRNSCATMATPFPRRCSPRVTGSRASSWSLPRGRYSAESRPFSRPAT